MAGLEFESRYGTKPFVGTTFEPAGGPPIARMRWLTGFSDVIEALRSPAFEQGGGGRRDSAAIIGGGLLSLSGPDHFERRRIEAALFRRPHLARLEREVFLPRFRADLEACPRDGEGRRRGDVQSLVRHALLGVSCALAGLDLDGARATETRLLALMEALAVGVNAEWLDRDHRDAIAEARLAMAAFEAEFFRPSFERRRLLVERHLAGEIDAASLPNDLITLTMLNRAHFGRWDDGVALREVVLMNGAPSSIPPLLGHVLQEVLDWAGQDRERRPHGLGSEMLRSACYETLRLHPATPFLVRRAVADVTMKSGTHVGAGEYVVVDLISANRDPAVYPVPEMFDPLRRPEGGVRPGALAFGSGPHTCIGVALTIGEAREGEEAPRGILVLALRELFARGVTRDPDRAPTVNPANVRDEYTSYPVRFAPLPA